MRGGRATHRLMTTYVTVVPYCYKLHSVQLDMMCNLRAVLLALLMQAAGGWRSCAEGVPVGRSAASASSVLSSEEHRKDR